VVFWEYTQALCRLRDYVAIRAVAGDMDAEVGGAAPPGRANIDRELILKGEAAGAFSIASTTEDATRTYDEKTKELGELVARGNVSPGLSQQISAQAMLLVAAQNSHIIRLLSRGVRLDGVDKALEYGERMKAKNHRYDQARQTSTFVDDALKPAPMMNFDLE
jgi:hypothetical protein